MSSIVALVLPALASSASTCGESCKIPTVDTVLLQRQNLVSKTLMPKRPAMLAHITVEASDNCIDEPGWEDSYHWDCAQYSGYQYACSAYGHTDAGPSGLVANDACCACGGGTPTSTPAPAAAKPAPAAAKPAPAAATPAPAAATPAPAAPTPAPGFFCTAPEDNGDLPDYWACLWDHCEDVNPDEVNNGHGCEQILESFPCDSDMYGISDGFQPGDTPSSTMCPQTCGSCGEAAPGPVAVEGNFFCPFPPNVEGLVPEDVNKYLACLSDHCEDLHPEAVGVSCEEHLESMPCDFDLGQGTSSMIPPGVTSAALCPQTCGSCGDYDITSYSWQQ